MKIKKIFGKDMREAMRFARNTLGPDAILCSHEMVNGGVELHMGIKEEHPSVATHLQPEDLLQLIKKEEIATPIFKPLIKEMPVRDDHQFFHLKEELKFLRETFQQQLIQQRGAFALHPVLALIEQRLMKLGLSDTLVDVILKSLPMNESFEVVWPQVKSYLEKQLLITYPDLLHQGGHIAFVGASGVGKTMTLVKFATRFVLSHGADGLAIVTLDTQRVGAEEILLRYGQLLGVSVIVVHSLDDFRQALLQLKNKMCVLIDTPGVNYKDSERIKNLGDQLAVKSVIQNYLVISASMDRNVLQESSKVYAQWGLKGCFLTKLDEAQSLGAVLSIILQMQLQLAGVSEGEGLTHHFHFWSARETIDRLLMQAQVSDKTSVGSLS